MADDVAVLKGGEAPRVAANSAVAALSPVSAAQRAEAGLAGLRGLRSKADGLGDEVADHLAFRHGATDAAVHPAPLPARRGPRPKSPVAPDIQMPYDGEEISWGGNLRADFPVYVLDQLNEFAHRRRCTQLSALLQMMAAFRDADGPVFFVREEDMVPDRRKATKKQLRSAPRAHWREG